MWSIKCPVHYLDMTANGGISLAAVWDQSPVALYWSVMEEYADAVWTWLLRAMPRVRFMDVHLHYEVLHRGDEWAVSDHLSPGMPRTGILTIFTQDLVKRVFHDVDLVCLRICYNVPISGLPVARAQEELVAAVANNLPTLRYFALGSGSRAMRLCPDGEELSWWRLSGTGSARVSISNVIGDHVSDFMRSPKYDPLLDFDGMSAHSRGVKMLIALHHLQRYHSFNQDDGS